MILCTCTRIVAITWSNGSLLLNFVFFGFMATDPAASRRADQAVMTRIMTGGTADNSALEAALGVSRPG